jgi:hypothetical protein
MRPRRNGKIALPAVMPPTPLTHHEILGLVEPFTRRGRHVDLPASDRLARHLHFKPLERGALREDLVLDAATPGRFQLTRTLTRPDGLQASLVAEGPAVDALLAEVESVAPERGFVVADGLVVAHHHRLAPGTGPAASRLVLTQGLARLAGLSLKITLSGVKGSRATVDLRPDAGSTLALPDDLLAVLGWAWTPLMERELGWQAGLALPGEGVRQGQAAEAGLLRAARHLAQTLAEPPARFHARWRWARWGVVLRRCIPLAVCVGLIAGAFAVPKLGLAQESMLRMLILNLPPLLLVAFFCLREMPRIEIPPLPRQPADTAWRPLPLPTTA